MRSMRLLRRESARALRSCRQGISAHRLQLGSVVVSAGGRIIYKRARGQTVTYRNHRGEMWLISSC